jgi:ABC-type dipeptide/oligopeptide/nickel transport system ATPase component
MPTRLNNKFIHVSPVAGVGTPIPEGWSRVRDLEMIILVGLTGSGKSTAATALEERNMTYYLLPNRREMTDLAIIPHYADGPVRDRVARFAITRQFNQDFAGGMAAVLNHLAVDPSLSSIPLMFDGLRGESEVRHAAALLPRARFVAVTAPDFVRLTRLLNRGDNFDHVVSMTPKGSASRNLGEGQALLSQDEIDQLNDWISLGQLDHDNVVAKLKIVAAERRNYDPDKTIAALRAAAPGRSVVIDTTSTAPTVVGHMIANLLGNRLEALGA